MTKENEQTNISKDAANSGRRATIPWSEGGVPLYLDLTEKNIEQLLMQKGASMAHGEQTVRCGGCGRTVPFIECLFEDGFYFCDTTCTPSYKKTELGALGKQIGGNHYKKGIQPWEYIEANGLDYWEGNVVKYITRWTTKNGIEDLKKAQHYLEYLIEREEQDEG